MNSVSFAKKKEEIHFGNAFSKVLVGVFNSGKHFMKI